MLRHKQGGAITPVWSHSRFLPVNREIFLAIADWNCSLRLSVKCLETTMFATEALWIKMNQIYVFTVFSLFKVNTGRINWWSQLRLLLLDLLALTSKTNIYHYNRTGRKNIDRKTHFQMKKEADQQLNQGGEQQQLVVALVFCLWCGCKCNSKKRGQSVSHNSTLEKMLQPLLMVSKANCWSQSTKSEQTNQLYPGKQCDVGGLGCCWTMNHLTFTCKILMISFSASISLLPPVRHIRQTLGSPAGRNPQ